MDVSGEAAPSVITPAVVLEVKNKSGVVAFVHNGNVVKARLCKNNFHHDDPTIPSSATLNSFLKVGTQVRVGNFRPLSNDSEHAKGIYFYAENVYGSVKPQRDCVVGGVHELDRNNGKPIPRVVTATIHTKLERIFIPQEDVRINGVQWKMCSRALNLSTCYVGMSVELTSIKPCNYNQCNFQAKANVIINPKVGDPVVQTPSSVALGVHGCLQDRFPDVLRMQDSAAIAGIPLHIDIQQTPIVKTQVTSTHQGSSSIEAGVVTSSKPGQTSSYVPPHIRGVRSKSNDQDRNWTSKHEDSLSSTDSDFLSCPGSPEFVNEVPRIGGYHSDTTWTSREDSDDDFVNDVATLSVTGQVIEGVICSLRMVPGNELNVVSFTLNGQERKAYFHRNKVKINGHLVSNSQASKCNLQVNMPVRVWKLERGISKNKIKLLASIDVDDSTWPQTCSTISSKSTQSLTKSVVLQPSRKSPAQPSTKTLIAIGQNFQGEVITYSKSCDSPFGLAEFKHGPTTYLAHFIVTQLKVGKRSMDLGFFSSLAYTGMNIIVNITKSSNSASYSFEASGKINISMKQLQMTYLKHENEVKSSFHKAASIKNTVHKGTVVKITKDAHGGEYPQLVSIDIKRQQRNVFIPEYNVKINGMCLKHYRNVRLKNYLNVGATVDITSLNLLKSTDSMSEFCIYEGSVAISDESLSLLGLLDITKAASKINNNQRIVASSDQRHITIPSLSENQSREFDSPFCNTSMTCKLEKTNTAGSKQSLNCDASSHSVLSYHKEQPYGQTWRIIPPEPSLLRKSRDATSMVFTVEGNTPVQSKPETQTHVHQVKPASQKINRATQTISTGEINALAVYTGEM